MEILSIVTNVKVYGGAEKVMLDLHTGLSQKFSSKILGLQSFQDVHPKYGLRSTEFLRLMNPRQLNNKILIVHSRNLIPFFVFLQRVFFLNVRIIYISHNVYDTFKKFTFFPKEVVSISNKVTENLLNYFKVPSQNISVIYNGMEDFGADDKSFNYKKDGKIRILYPARINKVKRQIDIIKVLKASDLDSNIEIHFAGIGEDYESLKLHCQDSRFVALGFVEDMHSLIQSYDFLMLFSIQEGLPLSLIEGAMHHKPLLVNDVGGNLEIGIPGENGVFLENKLGTLAVQLNRLNSISDQEYKKMSDSSRAVYKRNFGYQKMINKYTDLILKNGG